MQKRHITVALAGNPNSGKSTLFNALTGSRQRVGNYPGVTVETQQGRIQHDDVDIRIVDLPGTYSLTAYSQDEIVARNFLLDDRPDVVVDILDSANLERNLYLGVQLIELGVPVVLALNMSDVARSHGICINVRMLSQLLGVPIVRTIANKKRGVEELLEAAIEAASNPASAVERQHQPNYGIEAEPHVRQLVEQLRGGGITEHLRWYATKLLEGDEVTLQRLEQLCPSVVEDLAGRARRLGRHIRHVCGESPEIILADRRYGYISGACSEAVRQSVEARHERSDRIDAVMTNRYLGLPIFAVMMALVFQLTFAVGNPLVDWLDRGKVHLAEAVRTLGEADSLWISLLADGVIEGAGAVLVFLPLIAMLYLGISILEDSGYMARAAFLLDGLMHKIGLHGKSFLPMLIGFGCTVPAVMATRILESRRDRLTTMLILPLMSCGARLPVYVLLIGAFFPRRVLLGLGRLGVGADGEQLYMLSLTNQALLLFGIYMLGIVLAVLCARLLRSTVLKGEVTPFVMELPPYRVPALRGILVHMWERSREYVKKAGTIILALVIVLWALKTFPQLPAAEQQHFQTQRQALQNQANLPTEQLQQRLREMDAAQHRAELTHSAVGRIGRAITPVLAPCGFDWKISTALLGSFVAKEVFIGQMGLIYAVGDSTEEGSATLQAKLAGDYTPRQGLSILLFVLIASPCIATVAVTARESGSWKWAMLQWGYLTALAWVLTILVYQSGRLIQAAVTAAAA